MYWHLELEGVQFWGALAPPQMDSQVPVQESRFQALIYKVQVLHSEKFKMNEGVDSFLSEKVSNLPEMSLEDGQIPPVKCTGPCISGRETLRSNFKIESPSSWGIPVLRVYLTSP